MNIPNGLSFDSTLVDPGYMSERMLDSRTSPIQAPRFVSDGQRDNWWLSNSAFDPFSQPQLTTIDGIDSGLRN